MSDSGDSESWTRSPNSSPRYYSPPRSRRGRSPSDSPGAEDEKARAWWEEGKLQELLKKRAAEAKSYNTEQLEDFLTSLNKARTVLRANTYWTLAGDVPPNLTAAVFESKSDPFVTDNPTSEALTTAIKTVMVRVLEDTKDHVAQGSTNHLRHPTWDKGSSFGIALRRAAAEQGRPTLWEDLERDSGSKDYEHRWWSEIRRQSIIVGLKTREVAA